MITAQAQQMLRHLVVPSVWDRTKQRALESLATRLGFTYARTFNIYYGRAKRIDAHEWIKLTELKASAQTRREKLNELAIQAADITTRQSSGSRRPRTAAHRPREGSGG